KEIEDLKKDNTMQKAQYDLAAFEADVNSAVMEKSPPPKPAAPAVETASEPNSQPATPPASPKTGDDAA
ncbi:MAG TPA: hypothetical protein DF282_04110, partial [Hyphomonas sp.]|nr:hypothetical protein [Hyphomonas sp.]